MIFFFYPFAVALWLLFEAFLIVGVLMLYATAYFCVIVISLIIFVINRGFNTHWSSPVRPKPQSFYSSRR